MILRNMRTFTLNCAFHHNKQHKIIYCLEPYYTLIISVKTI